MEAESKRAASRCQILTYTADIQNISNLVLGKRREKRSSVKRHTEEVLLQVESVLLMLIVGEIVVSRSI